MAQGALVTYLRHSPDEWPAWRNLERIVEQNGGGAITDVEDVQHWLARLDAYLEANDATKRQS